MSNTPNSEPDAITRLAIQIQRDCARTTLATREIAITGGLSADEALARLAAMFSNSADKLEFPNRAA